MNKKSLFISLFLLALSSCSFNSVQKNIYSLPLALKEKENPNVVKLTFALTNHFDGELSPQKVFYKDNKNISIDVGGCNNLTRYANLLKDYYKDEIIFSHVGNIVNKNKNPLTSISCISRLEHDIIAPSATDISQKNLFLDSRLKNNFVIHNFLDLKTGKPIAESPFTSSKIIEKKGIKVGFISIVDPAASQAQTGMNYINGIYIEDAVTTILKEKRNLKKEGAQIIVLLLQTLTQCQGEIFSLKDVSQKQLECRYSDPLKDIVKRLPSFSIDLILSDSSNQMAHGYVAEIPILQNTGKTQFISLAELYYDNTKNELLRVKSRILPPLQICSRYFKETKDCYLKSDKKFRFEKKRFDSLGETPDLIDPVILSIPLEKY